MPVPSAITDLSTTASSNSPAGSETPADGDNYLRAHAAFIAQLNANKLDKTGSVTPTANQPMGGYKFTGAGNASTAGEFLVYGQDAVTNSVTSTSTVKVGENKLLAQSSLIGTGSVNLAINTSAGLGGGIVMACGTDTGGSSWVIVYAVAVRVSGGGGSIVTATSIGSSGGGTPPTIAFSDNAGVLRATVSGAAANYSYFCPIGGFG